MSQHQCASQCSGNCSGCSEAEVNGCPNCGRKGLEVPYETVDSLTKQFVKDQLNTYKDKQFYLCTQRPCKVAYYTEEAKLFVNQINVPIWFKHHKDEYIVCYCRRITLNDVIEAVNFLNNESTKENIVKYLNKSEVKIDCKHNNPTGLCCDKLFDNAIKYALNQKDINK